VTSKSGLLGSKYHAAHPYLSSTGWTAKSTGTFVLSITGRMTLEAGGKRHAQAGSAEVAI
jgi:hypothetical protein